MNCGGSTKDTKCIYFTNINKRILFKMLVYFEKYFGAYKT